MILTNYTYTNSVIPFLHHEKFTFMMFKMTPSWVLNVTEILESLLPNVQTSRLFPAALYHKIDSQQKILKIYIILANRGLKLGG